MGQTHQQRWAEVFGYIMGVFTAYDHFKFRDSTPQQIRVLYQQAARERRRRKAEMAHAAVVANSKNPGREIAKLEGHQ